MPNQNTVNIPSEISNACAAIGRDIEDMPYYQIQTGRILLSVGEDEDVMTTLDRLLPSWASAEYTGSANTDNKGVTTVDIAINWEIPCA